MTDRHLFEDRLNDYVDALLPAAETGEVERHLEECAECRAEEQRLRSLVADLATLPKAMAPGVDLRPGIRARIDQNPVIPIDTAPARRRVLWSLRYHLTAAAVILIIASSLVTRLMTGDDRLARAPAASSGSEVAFAHFEILEANYVRAADELLRALGRQYGALDPTTAALLERNLRVIDQAIRESRAALVADPRSDLLRQMLLATYERKLETIRQATALNASS